MIRLLAGAAFALAVVAAGPAGAACSVTGQVKLGDLPLGDADIATALGSAAPVTRGHSGADGRFAIPVEPLPANMGALSLIVSKPGHEPVRRILRKNAADGCPLSPQEPVAFDPGTAVATTGATGDTEASLCAQRSSLGLTVFIAPYEIYGGADKAATDRLNQDLPKIVYNRIKAFATSLSGVPLFDISVEKICLVLSEEEGERAQKIGHSLNALGVITGNGDLRQDQGKTVIDLESVLRTMPAYKSYGATALPIEDTIPSESLRPSKIAEHLRDLWGKQIVLAYTLQRLANLPASPDSADIAKLAALMVSLRKTMTADDPLLGQVEQVQALLNDLKPEP